MQNIIAKLKEDGVVEANCQVSPPTLKRWIENEEAGDAAEGAADEAGDFEVHGHTPYNLIGIMSIAVKHFMGS